MNLPIAVRMGKLPLIVTRMAPSHVPILREWMTGHSERHQGTQEDNDLPLQAFERIQLDRHTSLAVFDDSKANEPAIVGALMVAPSPLCRSTHPVNSITYTVVRPDLSSKGIGTYLTVLGHRASWHSGFLENMVQTPFSKSRILDKSKYDELLGVLPHSLFVQGKGRVSEYVFHRHELEQPDEYPERRATLEKRCAAEIPALATSVSEIPAWTFTDTVMETQSCRVTSYASPCTIRAGTVHDVLTIEEMIRRAAKTGNGFAMDEFTDGFFNRRFLRECHSAVMCSPEGTVIGSALFGPSAICNSKTTPVLQFYIVVSLEGKKHGVGRYLINAITEYALKNDFVALYGDAFDLDIRATQFLIRNGFKKTCSLPNSAFVHGLGLTDASLYYKDITSQLREIHNIHET